MITQSRDVWGLSGRKADCQMSDFMLNLQVYTRISCSCEYHDWQYGVASQCTGSGEEYLVSNSISLLICLCLSFLMCKNGVNIVLHHSDAARTK